jgi:two-component system sensor histidine kinase UhpB
VEGGEVAPIVELRQSGRDVSVDTAQIKNQIARELHDQVAQNLTALLMQTQVFAGEQAVRPDVVEQLTSVQTSVRQVLNNVRQILSDLRGKPGLADDLILALREGLLPTFRGHTGMNVRLWVSRAWPETHPPETCIHIYRIIQEALINARRHREASIAHVALRASSQRVVITIRDNGRGIHDFDPDRLFGTGILGMRQRAVLLGGTLTVKSGPVGGTAVTVSIPKEALHWSPKRERPGF